MPPTYISYEPVGMCWNSACRVVGLRCSEAYCPECCAERHKPGKCKPITVNETGEFGEVKEVAACAA